VKSIASTLREYLPQCFRDVQQADPTVPTQINFLDNLGTCGEFGDVFVSLDLVDTGLSRDLPRFRTGWKHFVDLVSAIAARCVVVIRPQRLAFWALQFPRIFWWTI
jgi:hypothetical protein